VLAEEISATGQFLVLRIGHDSPKVKTLDEKAATGSLIN
jgi:hypothetical protein